MSARALAVTALALAACPSRTPPRAPAAACPTTPQVVTAQAQVDALAGCASLPALTLRGAAPLDLAPLATLTTVDGDLVIGPTFALDRVHLPGLATVGGRVAIVSGGTVTAIQLPALTTAGALEIRDHLSLAQLVVSRLATVTGAVTIVRVPTLELVDAGALTAIGGDLTVAAPALSTWLGTPPAPAGTRTVDAPGLAGPPPP